MKRVSLPENENNPSVEEQYEHGSFIVEVCRTIFGGRRICIREEGNSYYNANWCAGDKVEDKELLLKAAEKVIDEDMDYPFCSEPKPYFKDTKFMNFLKKLNL